MKRYSYSWSKPGSFVWSDYESLDWPNFGFGSWSMSSCWFRSRGWSYLID